MKNIHLTFPTASHQASVMEFRDEFLVESHHIPGAGGLENYDTYGEWLSKAYKDLHGPIEAGRVTASQYLALDSANMVVGVIQLRHELNEYLENYGGHIGYSVRPSERRKGYASAMLSACLEEAKRLGISRVLVTCDNDNEASEGVIRKAGGIYEDTREAPNEKPKKRFWITTTSN